TIELLRSRVLRRWRKGESTLPAPQCQLIANRPSGNAGYPETPGASRGSPRKVAEARPASLSFEGENYIAVLDADGADLVAHGQGFPVRGVIEGSAEDAARDEAWQGDGADLHGRSAEPEAVVDQGRDAVELGEERDAARLEFEVERH